MFAHLLHPAGISTTKGSRHQYSGSRAAPEVSQKNRERSADDSLDLQAQERRLIERALERFRGNRREAAEALKISTVTLWRKMKQYGLDA